MFVDTFSRVLTGEMAESRAKRVRIKEVDGWTLGLLVDYIYTAEIQVTEENVQVHLRVSKVFYVKSPGVP